MAYKVCMIGCSCVCNQCNGWCEMYSGVTWNSLCSVRVTGKQGEGRRARSTWKWRDRGLRQSREPGRIRRSRKLGQSRDPGRSRWSRGPGRNIGPEWNRQNRWSWGLVLLSSTKIMTKYRHQRTFITWWKRDETQRKCWSCDDDDN